MKRAVGGKWIPVAYFPKPKDVGPREWGHEVLLATSSGKWTLKLITMRQGAKGGLQKHHLKDEGGVMTSGSMKIIYDDGSGNLRSRVVGVGDSFHFPPGAVHQAEALTAVSYIEVSTPHFNDRIHCEADYGIEKEEGGLPSTSLEDVELR
jgi:mannose-6-phosphate isomerase-like protein (cupin superfamily)